jgi:hypothetical protein
VLGADRFAVTAGRWRLIGIDAQLLSSGLPEEEQQWRWLTGLVADVPRGDPIGIFTHKPLDGLGREETLERPARYVDPEAEIRLEAIFAEHDVRLVVSGHVHQWGVRRRSGRTSVWAPSTWAVLPEAVQPTVAEKRTGIVGLTLHDDGAVEVQLIQPPGFRELAIGLAAFR